MSYQTYEVRVFSNGSKKWFKNDLRHREDGPAIERPNGTKEWFQNGQRRREDGPAIECADGYKAWYLNGVYLTEQEFNERMNGPPLVCTFCRQFL